MITIELMIAGACFMIHLQIVRRENDNVQSLIRAAIASGKIKSFKTAQVHGGLKIKHKTYLGVISIKGTKGPLLATVRCHDRSKEWQLLEAFVGRLAYHFSNEIAGINIQFQPKE
jgi:hypothetical protein